MGDRGRSDPYAIIVHDDDRLWGLTILRLSDGYVDGPNQPSGIGHPGIEGHDVQVVGVASQDVAHQVGCPRDRLVRVDRRLSMERGITAGQSPRRGGAIYQDRW